MKDQDPSNKQSIYYKAISSNQDLMKATIILTKAANLISINKLTNLILMIATIILMKATDMILMKAT